MKKIAFLGDSITEGCCVNLDERYPTLLCKKLNCIEANYGIGGTRIARQTKPSDNPLFDLDFVSRVETVDKDADLVIVFGGTNDYGHGDALLGTEKDESVYTYYGAVKQLIKLLLARFDKNKILFIIPLPRLGQEASVKGDNVPLKIYKDILIHYIKLNNLDYISFDDLLSTDGLISKYTVDGLHPNPEFHEIMAQKLKDYIDQKGYLK